MAQFLQAEGIVIGDGAGQGIALSIKEGIIRNLHQSLATFLQARAPQSGSVIAGGSINYRIPLYGQTKAYAQDQVVNAFPNVANIGVKVSDYRTSFTEIEGFDQSMLGPEGQSAIAEIVANISQQIRADQNAHFYIAMHEYFAGLYDSTSSTWTKTPHLTQTLWLPELGSKKVLSEDQSRLLQKEVANKINSMTKFINKKYIGIKGSEFFGIIDRFGATNLSLLLTRLNASNEALGIMVNSFDGDTLETFKFGGVNFLIDNFVNNVVAQGASFNGDYAIDLSGVYGYLIHREFIAFPMGIEQVVSVMNPNNGNMRWIAKYCFGAGILRPELGCEIIDTVKAVTINASTGVETPVGDTLSISATTDVYDNIGDARDVTVASSDTGKATVARVGNKVTITKVASGSTTVTWTVGGSAVKTVTVTVA